MVQRKQAKRDVISSKMNRRHSNAPAPPAAERLSRIIQRRWGFSRIWVFFKLYYYYYFTDKRVHSENQISSSHDKSILPISEINPDISIGIQIKPHVQDSMKRPEKENGDGGLEVFLLPLLGQQTMLGKWCRQLLQWRYYSWYFEEGGVVLCRSWCGTLKRPVGYFEDGGGVL